MSAGFKTTTIFGREKTGFYGEATADSFYLLPIESGSPVKEKETAKASVLTGNAGYAKTYTSKINASASFTFLLSYTGLEVLFLCALGHQQIHSVEDLRNGFYKHVIEPDTDIATDFFRTNDGFTTSDNLSTNTVKSRRLTIIQDKVVSRHKMISALVNKLTISGSAGELVKGSVDLLGYDVVRENSPLPSYQEVNDFINFADSAIEINGQPFKISSFEFTLDNKLTQVQKNDLHLEEPLRSAPREVSLKFTLPVYETDEFHSLYENGDEVRIELIFSKGDGNEIRIVLPRAQITSASSNVSGEGLIPNEVEAIALESKTPEVPSQRNVEVYVTLTNQISTEVWNL